MPGHVGMLQDRHHGLLIDTAFEIAEALPVCGAEVWTANPLRRVLYFSVTELACGCFTVSGVSFLARARVSDGSQAVALTNDAAYCKNRTVVIR